MAYSQKALIKYNQLLNEAIQGYKTDLAEGRKVDLCISKGNRKIGRVPNVSLPAIKTCGGACRVCLHLCYDIKACLQYGNVLRARARNYALYMYSPREYFRQLRCYLGRRRNKDAFRFHVGGDIPDPAYLEEMIDTALAFPETKFWTYTKQYHIVNAYVETHGGNRFEAIPSNLSIMFSEWNGLPMINPYGFPTFSVVMDDDLPEVKARKRKAYKCPGNCDICKAKGRGCVVGESAQTNQH